MSSNNVLFAGLPGSGRATYLAALWHQIESGETSTQFVTRKLQPDREFLNKIRDSWLSFEELPGLPKGIDKATSLHLRHVASGAEIDVSIPDFTDDSFAAQWTERRIPAAYALQLRSCLGLLLFVHSMGIRDRSLISGSDKEVTTSGALLEWEPGITPTQVRLVDTLQTAIELTESDDRLRVALIVSAWDQTDSTEWPEEWVSRRLPLLQQFVSSNADLLDLRIYGVSATGGGRSEFERLARMPLASNRARIQMDADVSTDLTLPFAFLSHLEPVR